MNANWNGQLYKVGARIFFYLGLAAFMQHASAQDSFSFDVQSALAGRIGALTLAGQTFGPGIPLDPSASDPAVGTIGRFHAATLNADRTGTLAAICPADQAGYSDLIATDDDAQLALQFLQPFSTRTARLRINYGTYTVVFAVLSGPNIEPLVRDYPLKIVNGSFCMTFDLRGDPAYNMVVNLISGSITQ